MQPVADDRVYLVFLETAGNQSYIFGTNKLRENIGASEQIFRIGTEQVAQAVRHTFKVQMPLDAEQLPNWLCTQLPIEDRTANRQDVEVIVATSGKAILLVRNQRRAKEFVTYWSSLVLSEAPGIDAHAVLTDPVALGAPSGLAVHEALKQAHERYDEERARRRPALARFLALPFLEPCRSNGLPAEGVYTQAGRQIPASAVTLQKRAQWVRAQQRFKGLLPASYELRNRQNVRIHVSERIDRLEEDWSFEWLGVIHADGNGLGQIFLDLHQHAERLIPTGAHSDRWYVNLLRLFSLELDKLTRSAFREATFEVFDDYYRHETNRRKLTLPVVPIVVGGDDLTVVCDGRRALQFTRSFLKHFEHLAEQSSADSALARLCKEAFGHARIGMSAGVAIVKPHFPFSTAYHLAEELLASAKVVKARPGVRGIPCSSFDFHIAYDTTATSLGDIRKRLERSSESVRLHTRPLIATDQAKLSSSDHWVHNHHAERFEEAVCALKHTSDDGRRSLPSSQAHQLRTALHEGASRAQSLFDLLVQRYKPRGFHFPEGLFVAEEDGWRATRFQDALEALEFCPHLGET